MRVVGLFLIGLLSQCTFESKFSIAQKAGSSAQLLSADELDLVCEIASPKPSKVVQCKLVSKIDNKVAFYASETLPIPLARALEKTGVAFKAYENNSEISESSIQLEMQKKGEWTFLLRSTRNYYFDNISVKKDKFMVDLNLGFLSMNSSGFVLSINLNDKKSTVNTTLVPVSFDAERAASMFITKNENCQGDGEFVPFEKSLVFDFGPATEGDTFTLYGQFKGQDGSKSKCVKASIVYDTIAPIMSVFTSIQKSKYAKSKDVVLTIETQKDDAVEYYLTATSGCNEGGEWKNFKDGDPKWVLQEIVGNQSIYAAVKDEAGNVSECAEVKFILDLVPPTLTEVDFGKSMGVNQTHPIVVKVSSDDNSGIDHYLFAIGTQSGIQDVLDWKDIGNEDSYQESNVYFTYGESYVLQMKAVDAAGNESAVLESAPLICGWASESFLTPQTAKTGDQHGFSVDINQNRAVVGAPQVTSSGKGYVSIYERSGSTWTIDTTIAPSSLDASDAFGYAVAVSGDTIAVAARADDSSQTSIIAGSPTGLDNSLSNSGGVYILKKTGSAWGVEAFIKAPNAGADDYFGSSIALDGDTLVVSAPKEDGDGTSVVNGSGAYVGNNNSTDTGIVYVFKRSGTVWTRQAILKAPNADANDEFGNAVAIHGDVIVVSAMKEASSQKTVSTSASSNNSSASQGAAYVYRRSGTQWAFEAYLKADTAAGSLFGRSVDIHSTTIVVGAQQASNNGAAFVFKSNGSEWSEVTKLVASNKGANDGFGYAVSVYDETIAVGALFEDGETGGVLLGDGVTTPISEQNGKSNSGAVYIFSLDDSSNWVQASYLKTKTPGVNDQWGASVSLYNDSVLTGSLAESVEAFRF